MKGRDKLFFNLLTFLLVVVLVLVGVKTREADKQIKRWQIEIKKRQERGVQDPQLRETVDKLEADLQARIKETFSLEEDPLDLTRVIKTKKFLKKMGMTERAESEYRLRLSATITGEKSPSAIVKYQGRSHVISVGDRIGPKLAKYIVKRISSNEVYLVRGEEDLILTTEKAPDTQAEEEKRIALEGEKKLEVHVKEIPIGNY